MSERAPQNNEVISSQGRITETFRRFVSQLAGILNATLAISPSIRTFDSKVDLDATFPMPRLNQTAWVEGEGFCRFDGTVWRKYDDTVI